MTADPRSGSIGQPADGSRLKVGLHLPFAEEMMDGETPGWDDLKTMARLAEDAGFDSVWLLDHLIARFDWGTVGVWECWSNLAALASVTSRIELGPLVTPMSFRNPALLAKMADTVDEISGGRLILGLGAGWHEPEYTAFGYPFDHLASRFEEGIQIVHTLLRTGQVDFEGAYHQARECELRPRGPRGRPLGSGPPIMFGTLGPRMLRIMARYADMWNAEWVVPGVLPEQNALVDAACRDVGRDPATIERTASVKVNLPDWEPRGFHGEAEFSAESIEDLAEYLRQFGDQGITHLQVWINPNSPAGIESFTPVLDLLERD